MSKTGKPVMAKPRVFIIRAPGTNCDQETAFAFQQCGAEVEVAHLNRWLESPSRLTDYQILCFPGGFSYGDDIAAGRIVASQLQNHLANELREFTAQDRLVLGICNGFQILIKSGLLLPPTDEGRLPATLNWNNHGRFEDRWVHLKARSEQCVFLRGVDQMYLPIAHAEGKFMAMDESTLDRLDQAGQLALRYCDAAGEDRHRLEFPDNPNGSQRNVAGICDESGRVFGLMPHPERHFDPTHHPQWTRLPRREKGEGAVIFENAVSYFD